MSQRLNNTLSNGQSLAPHLELSPVDHTTSPAFRLDVNKHSTVHDNLNDAMQERSAAGTPRGMGFHCGSLILTSSLSLHR